MSRKQFFIPAAVSCLMTVGMFAVAALAPRGLQAPSPVALAAQSPTSAATVNASANELRIGADLTRRGLLKQAIPHLLAAKSAGLDPYAVGVNLGICYLGSGDYGDAITDLESLRASGHKTLTVYNLLAQAYLADGRTTTAFQIFQEASAGHPKDEKLYAYMADACTDYKDYALGLKMMDMGLQQLPNSARLHYERALFLGRLGRFEEAKPEFDRAAELAPGSYIGYLSKVQEYLYEDDLPDANRVLDQAIKSGHGDYRMLSLLGSVLLFEGAAPGQPQFSEARQALEKSVQENPSFSSAQIELGRLYLREGRYKNAAEHLEIGRRLQPDDPAVYTGLATAYNRLGEREKAREMTRQLGRLLAQKKGSATPTSK